MGIYGCYTTWGFVKSRNIVGIVTSYRMQWVECMTMTGKSRNTHGIMMVSNLVNVHLEDRALTWLSTESTLRFTCTLKPSI
jgi:hypothetical protein